MTKKQVENQEIAVVSVPKALWGEANDRRGKGYTDLAIVFVRDHPITSLLTTEIFDQWLQDHRMLKIPDIEAPKNSDAWLGHLQRRHQCRNNLNKAATHPRMIEYGSTAFTIVAIHGGFEVQAIHSAIVKGELPRKIMTLTQTKKRQLAYLMQSADWSVLPAHERSIAETIYDDIEAFAEDARIGTERISRKLGKLEAKIRTAVETGEIVPVNHGLARLLAPEESLDNDVSTSDEPA